MRDASSVSTGRLADAVGFAANVFVPTLAKGPIIRRPMAMAMAERAGLDRRAVRFMQKMQDRHGEGPLLLKLPVRDQAILLTPEQVARVLDGSPEPFATASREKRQALKHFEPKGALISDGAPRAARRAFNEAVLEFGSPVHSLAGRFVEVAAEEAQRLADKAGKGGTVDWKAFVDAWFYLVRRVVFGDSARDDRELTDMIARLRHDANWAFLRPTRKRLRARFLARVKARLNAAEPGSVASLMGPVSERRLDAPHHQVPQWLFAFDPAGMAAWRTLALLSTHGRERRRALAEIAADESGGRFLPFLRACVLDALRLWPTTPMILRETTRPTVWGNRHMAAGTGVLIFAPYFHRDERRVPFAHRFNPDAWGEDGRPKDGMAFVPFSDGPATCPGKPLVLLLASAFVAELMKRADLRLLDPQRLDPGRPLPASQNHFSLRFVVEGRSG